ncbi:hypothetical protein MTO96_007298 [Rhipicephalus appendiculatus]
MHGSGVGAFGAQEIAVAIVGRRSGTRACGAMFAPAKVEDVDVRPALTPVTAPLYLRLCRGGRVRSSKREKRKGCGCGGVVLEMCSEGQFLVCCQPKCGRDVTSLIVVLTEKYGVWSC